MLKAMLGEAWLAMGPTACGSALTMLGMVIGVGAVVLMMAIGRAPSTPWRKPSAPWAAIWFIVISGPTAAGVRSGGGGGRR